MSVLLMGVIMVGQGGSPLAVTPVSVRGVVGTGNWLRWCVVWCAVLTTDVLCCPGLLQAGRRGGAPVLAGAVPPLLRSTATLRPFGWSLPVGQRAVKRKGGIAGQPGVQKRPLAGPSTHYPLS